jgi:aspartate carbamoyltransferase catalytic subunit
MKHNHVELSHSLLGLKDLNKDQIRLILEQAKHFKGIVARPIKKVPALVGKSLVTLFYEPSTRTRTSFGLAGKLLGADTINISIETSSVCKGETIIDTVANLEAMGIDGIIIRHSMAGAPHLVARHSKASVINAGDGFNEHPTQALLDIFTMEEKKGSVAGKKVVIVGDIAHSRVARSNIWGLTKLGAEVVVVGPPTLIPVDIEKTGAKVSYELDPVIKNADFINVLRIQKERMEEVLFPSIREYFDLYCITYDRLKKARKDVLIMHPGPINRGVEIASDVADGPDNVILEQVANGVAVRMAILYLLLRSRPVSAGRSKNNGKTRK